MSKINGEIEVEYKMTQAELCQAVQLYLNEQVLHRPVEIVSVKPIGYPKPTQGSDLALSIVALDNQNQIEGAEESSPPGDD